MKRTLSLVLSLALLLGLLPGTVLAEGEAQAEPRQLYAISGPDGNQYFTEFSTRAGGTSSFFLATEDGGEALDKQYYAISCDTEVGTIAWKNDESKAVWDTRTVHAEDGASGNIYATYHNGNDTEVYRLPVTVNGRPFKLYDARTEGNRIRAGENGNYNVTYTAFEGKSCYFCIEGDLTFAEEGCSAESFFQGNDGNSVAQIFGNRISDKVFVVSINSGFDIDATAPVTLVVGNQTYNFNITFTTGSGEEEEEVTGMPFALYDVETGGNLIEADEAGNYTVTHTGDNNGKIYYFRPAQGKFFDFQNSSISKKDGAGNDVIKHMGSGNNLWVIMMGGNRGAWTAPVTITMSDGSTYNFNITFVDNSPPSEVLISAEHARTDADTYSGNFVLGTSHLTASFEVETDQKYIVYMIPQGPNFENANQSGSNEPLLTPGELQNLEQGIGFFTKENDAYKRITNRDLLSAIQNKVSDMSLRLFAIAGNDYPLAETIPAIYKINDTSNSFNNICLKMGFAHRGYYIFQASCTVDGNVLTSETRLEWRPTLGYFFTPDMSAQKDPIVQINEFLGELNYDENASVVINLPAGEFTGYITVPAELGRMRVFVNGTRENGSIKTTLNGGMVTLNFSVTTRYINFVGAGAGQKNWANDHTNKGRPNQALYGGNAISGNGANFGGGSHSDNCTFRNYDIAIYSTYRLRTAANNLFQDNNIALCYDTLNADGGSDMTRNEFNGNKIGIHFKRLNDTWHAWFVLSGTKFVDNETDVRNDLNRNIYMPGCYFADTGNDGGETIRECRYLPVAKGNLKKQVLYYPQAETRECNSFVFRTGEDSNGFDLYKFDPVISTNFTATFPIPEDVLKDSTFVVKKGDKLLARFIFD